MSRLLFIKKSLIYIFFLILSLFIIIVFRAVIYFPLPKDIELCENTKDHQIINGTKVIDRFIESIRFRTITKAQRDYDREELTRFIEFIKNKFPHLHSSPVVKLELINEFSMLYTVTGENPNLKPYLLIAHLDVVPVEIDKWDVPPFDGVIKDGFIYGRGTLDVKDATMGILESLEFLIEHNIRPQRSFYIAFGHDEEGRGVDGAAQVAKHFRERSINEFEFILDEGTFIFKQIPGISYPIAMISVTEKGMMSLKLTAHGRVGHSSIPPAETAIIVLAKAVSKLDSYAHPNMFGYGPERAMLESIAPYTKFPYKLILANLWLFGPIVSRFMGSYNFLNSFVRTTTAVTIFHSGFKDNILPGEASAVVNHRVHPLNSVSGVLEYDRKLINDERITIEFAGHAIEPHKISLYGDDIFGYETIKRSIREVFPDTAVVPGIFIASSDTRWYLNFTNCIYRFTPGYINIKEDFGRIHGHNERISIENYIKLVNFYYHVMRAADLENLDSKKLKDEL